MKVIKSGIQAFAHAAALDKDGRLSNTIYCQEKDVFILNQDHSVLIRFQFQNSEFENPICFRAEDFDSNELYEKDGKIIFVQKNESWIREKSCQVPGRTSEDVKRIWKSLKFPRGPKVILDKSLLQLLDSSLSHVELSITDKKLIIIQRNIYNGTNIQIERSKGSGHFGSLSGDDLKLAEYGPVGMRTGDLLALFSFCNSLELIFPSDPYEGYFYINGARTPGLPSNLQAFVCLCAYDEMGDIQYLLKEKEEDNGRQKQEKRGSEPGADRKAKERTKSQ